METIDLHYRLPDLSSKEYVKLLVLEQLAQLELAKADRQRGAPRKATDLLCRSLVPPLMGYQPHKQLNTSVHNKKRVQRLRLVEFSQAQLHVSPT
jgi:hypothetical protein